MKAKVSMNIQGFATWHIKNAKGEIVQENATPYPNLVLDAGLEKLAASAPNTQTARCNVGTGATPPAPSDTGLESAYGPEVNGSSLGNTSSTAPYYQGQKKSYTFSAGTIDGVALAELGFKALGAVQWSRLLFRDGSLNPTTITLLPDEILVVTYELRVYPNTTDVTGTFDVDDGLGGITTHSYTLRPSQVTAVTWSVSYTPAPAAVFLYETDVLGDVTGTPSGSATTATTYALSPYVPNSKRNVASLTCGLTNANYPTGIGSMRFFQRTPWQISFSPKLPKDATKTLNFPDFIEFSWAAGTP